MSNRTFPDKDLPWWLREQAKWLRANAAHFKDGSATKRMLVQAAARIEELEAALRDAAAAPTEP